MKENDLVIVSTATLILVILTMIFIYMVFLRKKTSLLIKQKEKDIWFEKELAKTQVEIKEQTLNYIGQELHDDLGQKLSVVRLRQNQLIAKLKDKQKDELTEMNELLGECIQDIRNLSKTFITEQIIHFGLLESLEREVRRIRKLKLLKIDLEIPNETLNISPSHSLILFRIIQESINNILKHSKAKQVRIAINCIDKAYIVKIIDNGKGFNKNNIQDGSGLKNMELRAKLIGAEFCIESLIDKGTTTTIKYIDQGLWKEYQ